MMTILAELTKLHDMTIQAEQALRKVDWNYDIDGLNGNRFSRGSKLLMDAEKQIGDLYKVSPDKAHELWESYCPYAVKGSFPFGIMNK